MHFFAILASMRIIDLQVNLSIRLKTHINYYLEVSEGESLSFTTQILGLDSKRLHFFHQMIHAQSGDLLATTEQMLIHVDTKKSKASEIMPAVAAILGNNLGFSSATSISKAARSSNAYTEKQNKEDLIFSIKNRKRIKWNLVFQVNKR